MLREPIQSGQKIKSFTVRLKRNNSTVKEINGKTIGTKRILTFANTEADSLDFIITDSKLNPSIREIAVYEIDENLIEK